MVQTFRDVMDDIYDYPVTPIWSSDDIRLGRRYRIVASDAPDYVYLPLGAECAYTSLRNAERCRYFTTVEPFRRELARLYITGVGSPSPDTISAFPDIEITEDEMRALSASAEAALYTIQNEDESNGVRDQLARVIGTTTKDVKTLLALVDDVADELQHASDSVQTQVKQLFPTDDIRQEFERRLWEREHRLLTEVLPSDLR